MLGLILAAMMSQNPPPRWQVPLTVPDIVEKLPGKTEINWRHVFIGLTQSKQDKLQMAGAPQLDQQQRWCWWLHQFIQFLDGRIGDAATQPLYVATFSELRARAQAAFERGCTPPGTGAVLQAANEWIAAHTRPNEAVAGSPDRAPFAMPAMVDRAGGDLALQLLPMLRLLEARLASAGHRLEGGARACAWAVASASAVGAIQGAGLSTPGIDAGGRTFAALRADACVGEARARQEAAWRWLRANPGATQPLEVAARPAAPPWPASSLQADVPLWLAAFLLFSVPVVWPVAVTSAAP